MKKLLFKPHWLRTDIIFIAIFATMLFLSGCSSKKNANGQTSARKNAFRPDTVEVQATKVQARNFTRTIRSTGTLVAKHHAQLRFMVPGIITKINADIGDYAKKGTVLLQIRKIDYKLALEQAKANYARAKASFENARQNYHRIANLYKAGSATSQQRDQAKAGYDEARAALQQSKAAMDDAQQKLDDTTIRAPYNGYVTHRYDMVGEYANVAQPAFDFTDLSVLEAEMDLPERYAGSVPVGLKAKISFLSGFAPVEGVVTRVNPSINTDTRTFEIKVQVQNPKFTLPNGLFCTGTFVLPELKNKPAIPKEAISQLHGQSIVWVIKNGRAHLQQVTAGATNGNWVMIDSGLKIGEMVATSGTTVLINNYPVKIESSSTPTNN